MPLFSPPASSCASLPLPEGASGFGMAMGELPERGLAISSIMENMRKLGYLTSHPKGGLLLSRPSYLVAGGAQRIALTDGAIAWRWRAQHRYDTWRELVLLGWPEDNDARLYPALLWRDKITIATTGPLEEQNSAPWRAHIDTPAARVVWSRGAVARGEGFVPLWLMGSIPTEPLSAEVTAFAAAASPLVLGALVEGAAHDAHVWLAPSIQQKGQFVWNTRCLDLRLPVAQLAHDTAIKAARQAVYALLQHPSCPLRPIHMAHCPPRGAMPCLWDGTIPSAHARLHALHAWQAYGRDSHGYGARAFAPSLD